jgi:hypothetical protein
VKRVVPLLTLIGFLTFTGVFIVVYLFRALRIGQPVPGEVVRIWHGDDFLRAILASILFLIGLVVLLGFVEFTRAGRFGARGVRLRPDLRAWVEARSEHTGEDPTDIVDRAVATYRDRLESPRQ